MLHIGKVASKGKVRSGKSTEGLGWENLQRMCLLCHQTIMACMTSAHLPRHHGVSCAIAPSPWILKTLSRSTHLPCHELGSILPQVQ